MVDATDLKAITLAFMSEKSLLEQSADLDDPSKNDLHISYTYGDLKAATGREKVTKHTVFDGRVHVYRRENSRYWQCSTFLHNRNWRVSTGKDSIAEAMDFAEDWYLGFRGKSRAGILKSEKTFREAAHVFRQEYAAITAGERNAQYVTGHWTRIDLHLNPFFGSLGLSEVTPVKVMEYRIKRRGEKVKGKDSMPTRSTLHKEIVTLRQVLKTAQMHGWLDSIPNLSEPYKKAGKFNRRAWFSPDEYKQLYNATRERAASPLRENKREDCEDLHDYVLLMVNTGLRPDEANKLQFRDVQIVKEPGADAPILHIDVRGKRGVGYCKSMPGAVFPFRRIVTRRTPRDPDPQTGKVRTHPLPNDPVFPRAHADLFDTILKEQGLKFDRDGQRRSAYSLRHTYISMRLMEGADIYQIAKNCRTSVEMIEQHYAAHIKNMVDVSAINIRKPRSQATRILETIPVPRAAETPRAKGFRRISGKALAGKDALAKVPVVRGRGEIGRRKGLESLSAPGEIPDAELPKLGETGNRQSRAKRDGGNTGTKV